MNSNERKDKKDENSSFDTATKVIGVVGAIGAVAGLVAWMSSGSGEKEPQEKMMKAPGKDGYIVRQNFEDNPKKYFEELHKYKK